MSTERLLALGADMKNRFIVADDRTLRQGPDIGDLSDARNYSAFKREVLKALKDGRPAVIACDMHPGYFSHRFAAELTAVQTAAKGTTLRHPISILQVQHHHAHIASVMQEHGLKGPVIGVSFDGTGYGSDGNIWGGEFLRVSESGFGRLAHLKYRMMPGGDMVVREPWRMLLSILGKRTYPILRDVKKEDKDIVLWMMAKGINSPLTSSAGRLFDAAAALLGIARYASFEAEGPIRLEKLCKDNIKSAYKFRIKDTKDGIIIDTDRVFSGMLKDLRDARGKVLIATKFHNSMAAVIIDVARRLSEESGIEDIVLSGGVFQNAFLKRRAVEGLTAAGLKVFANSNTPINDFNISLGQLYVSRHSR